MFLENVVSITFCPLVILALIAKHLGFMDYEQAVAPLCILGWSYMLFFFLGILFFIISFSLFLTLCVNIFISFSFRCFSLFFVFIAFLPSRNLPWNFKIGFQLTGPFVVMIVTMLKTDVLRFSVLFGVFLVGFSQGNLLLKLFVIHFLNTFQLSIWFWTKRELKDFSK